MSDVKADERIARSTARREWIGTDETPKASSKRVAIYHAVQGFNAGWDAGREAIVKIVREYEDWFQDSPEDSWRLQRDLMAALGIEPEEER